MDLIKHTKNQKDSKNRSWRMAVFHCGECGNEVERRLNNGLRGVSCGCDRKYTHHGMAGNPLYKSWVGVLQRCQNPKNPRFRNWGGRGITVCDVLRFVDNVEQFAFAEYIEYAIDSPEKIKRGEDSVIVFCRHSSGAFDCLIFSASNEIKKIDSQ